MSNHKMKVKVCNRMKATLTTKNRTTTEAVNKMRSLPPKAEEAATPEARVYQIECNS